MKLVLRALALTAVMSGAVLADGAQKCGASRFTGFFAGLNVGMSSISTKTAVENSNPTVTNREGGFGPFVGLHAGYGVGFGSFGYVAGSIYGNMASTKIGASGGVANGSFKKTSSFGINLDVGGTPSAMGNTILGVGLGFEWARFKLSHGAYTNQSIASDGTTVENTDVAAFSKTKTKFGFRPSLFAKTFVTKNVYVGLRGSMGMFGTVKGKEENSKVKNINDTAVTLEVGYKF